MLSSVPKDQWKSLEEKVLKILRDQYRKTWAHPSTRRALANVPNQMMVDDHEIRDDWGWREEDWDPNTVKPDYFYGCCARRVYYEYQRQLRDDIDFNSAKYG
jgi:phosphodiesterase/alkaline phosphatase D-like protein